jgi:Putative prokaryotic signal transducing protein
MVTIRTCTLLVEAQTMQSVLTGSGIESFLPDELTIQNNWMWSNAIGGVRIQVNEEDAARAEEILNGAFPKE